MAWLLVNLDVSVYQSHYEISSSTLHDLWVGERECFCCKFFSLWFLLWDFAFFQRTIFPLGYSGLAFFEIASNVQSRLNNVTGVHTWFTPIFLQKINNDRCNLNKTHTLIYNCWISCLFLKVIRLLLKNISRFSHFRTLHNVFSDDCLQIENLPLKVYGPVLIIFYVHGLYCSWKDIEFIIKELVRWV